MNERSIFMAALEKDDPTERAAFLEEACAGDTKLRQRVEALLGSHAGAGDFLGKPAPQRLAEEFAAGAETEATRGEPFAGDAAADELRFLTPSDRPDSLGRLGHYEVLEIVGRGGMGIVLRAFDEKLHRVVAVKVMSPALAATSPPRKRFLREARSAAAVRHEHVVDIHAVEEQPIPYLVMEYVSGETLQQKHERVGPFEVPEVLRLGQQIARGLAAAHQRGLIHRDIKPSNILLEKGAEECVKITDFGLARAVDDASLTQSGVIAGTPMYMAPEQTVGDSIDHRADLFSLGSVLYTMCSGRPPFRATTSMATLKRVAEDTPRPIREIIPEVPEWLCEIIAKLQAKKPDDRYQSAAEVAELLGRHLASAQPPPVIPTPAATALARPPRPVGTRLVMAAAAALLLVATGFGLTESTGVTQLRATVIRIFTPEGTLVVETDDPAVKVIVEGDGDLVITGAGPQEVRLKSGTYKLRATKDGKVVKLDRDLVTITRGDTQVVRVRLEGKELATSKSEYSLTGSFTVSVKLPDGKDPIVRRYAIRELFAEGADDLRMGPIQRAYPWGWLRVVGSPGPDDVLVLQRLRVSVDEEWDGVKGQSLGFTTEKTDFTDPRQLPSMRLTTAAGDLTLFFDESEGLDRAVITVAGALKFELVSVHGQAASAKVENGAFVVLGGPSVRERKFNTLAVAAQAACDGDTIEIQGDGPFETDPIQVHGRDLVIRAGPGCRPVLALSARGRDEDRQIIWSDAALALEGLTLQRIGSSRTADAPLINTVGSPLRVANCRFVVRDNTAVSIWGHSSPTVDVRNCEIFGSRAAVETGSPKEGTLSVDNCLLARGCGVHFHHDRQVHRVEVRLTRNTFAGRVAVGLNISVVPDFFASGSRPEAKRFELEVENNVFAVTECMFGVSRGAEAWKDKPVPTGPFQIVTDLVEWRDQRNLYPANATYMSSWSLEDRLDPLLGSEHLDRWRKFAGPEAGALRGKVLFAGGDVLTQSITRPERLLPEHFSLRPQSPGYRAGKDGKDLGANIDLVGPGTAYERWKKTPEYQQWLMSTGQKKAKTKAPGAILPPGGTAPPYGIGKGDPDRQAFRDPFESDRIAHLKIFAPQDKEDAKSVSPPKGAIVLFDGQGLDGWVNARREEVPATWKLREGGIMEARGSNIKTTKVFSKRFKLHVEFRVPYMPEAQGQDRGNSGIYVQGRYEVQVLDSYGLKSKINDCGAIFGIAAPLLNACKAPTIWQSYDIEFQAPTFEKGKQVASAVITVYQNGVKIHDQLEITTDNTEDGLDGDPSTPGPIMLQYLGSPVQYRNIWLVEQ
jgi:hypothetical protein